MTCGERAAVMAACEDDLIPVTVQDCKELTDEVWNRENPGLPENQRGTDLNQELDLIQYIGTKYGKQTNSAWITSAADLEDSNYRHKIFAVDLSKLNHGWAGNHFLKENPNGDFGGFVHVTDSDRNIDFGPDQYSEAAILAGGAGIFGAGNAFGIKFTWS